MEIFNETFNNGEILQASKLNNLKKVVNNIITDTEEGINTINQKIEDIGSGGGESVSSVTTPISCFKWSTTTPNKPSNTLNPYPWSLIALDKPLTGGDLYMCTGTKITRSDGTASLSGSWSSPIKLNGDPGSDDKEREWIYKYNNEGYNGLVGQVSPGNNAANGSDGNKNQDDWVPEGWYDRALSIENEKTPIDKTSVYASYRDYDSSTKTWGNFNTPIVWSHWGEQGLDGDGTQYIYKLFDHELTEQEKENNRPNRPEEPNGNGEYVPTNWNDNPVAPDISNQYCYCSVIKQINGEWENKFGKLALWSRYSFSYSLIPEPSTLIYDPNTKKFVGANSFKFSAINNGENIENTDNIKVDLSGVRSNGTSTGMGEKNLNENISADSNFSSYNASLKMGNNILAKTSIPITKYGLNGDSAEASTGRMFYQAGEWKDTIEYGTDPNLCPVVYYNNKYWYLNQTTSSIGDTPGVGEVWKEVDNFGVVLTDAIFADFSKLGSFIISGDFFFSQYGELRRYNDTPITINGTNYNTQYVSGSDEKVPYGYFDPTDPTASNLDSNHPTKFMPTKIINALTGEEWMAKDKVHVDTNGSMTINNVDIKGSLMYNKLLVAYSSSLYNIESSSLFSISGYKPNGDPILSLDYNIALLTGAPKIANSPEQHYTFIFPPASFFPGASIRIINGTYQTANGKFQNIPSRIELIVGFDSATEEAHEDYELNYLNAFASSIPMQCLIGTSTLHNSVMGYSNSLFFDSHEEIELISTKNYFHTQNSNEYVWMVIAARGGISGNKNISQSDTLVFENGFLKEIV